jgi:hypothetical protein
MYINDLKSQIINFINQSHNVTFDDLFLHSRGAFPDIVYEISKDLLPSEFKIVNFESSSVKNSILPEPNPINYDWRFNDKTIGKIIEIIRDNNFSRICLFGTPSLFPALSNIISDVSLYDINSLIKNHFDNDIRVNIIDINNHDFSDISPVDCIVMDPPWYIDFYQIWLQKAESILKPNGKIYSTLFQELLRPKAKREITLIKGLAKQIGTFEILDSFLEYTTPTFEKELLKYKGIPCFKDWRIGDLLIINKLENNRLSYVKDKRQSLWQHLIIGEQTIAIKQDKFIQNKIKVNYPYPNGDNFIKSISDRDKIKKKINFITSRNKGLIIEGGGKVSKSLKAFTEGSALEDIYSNEAMSPEEICEFQKILTTIFV